LNLLATQVVLGFFVKADESTVSHGQSIQAPGVISGMVRFTFAKLCACFAFFAVRYLFYRKGRQERAKKRKEIQAQLAKCTGTHIRKSLSKPREATCVYFTAFG
jgi:hypothetical protein